MQCFSSCSCKNWCCLAVMLLLWLSEPFYCDEVTCFSAGNMWVIPNKAHRTWAFHRGEGKSRHTEPLNVAFCFLRETQFHHSEHCTSHKYLALCKLFTSAKNPYRTSSMSKVSLANSSISAAVPTNMRSSWDNWSRVISTPMGRSHLPTTSSSRKVWWRASVHTVSQIVESWLTKTLACLKDNNNIL